MVIKINVEQSGGEILKKMNNNSISVRILTQDRQLVPFIIANRDSNRNQITLKLNFSNPQNISTQAVITLKSNLVLQDNQDVIEVVTNERIEHRTKEMLVSILKDVKAKKEIPIQMTQEFQKSVAETLQGGRLVVTKTPYLNFFM